MAHGKSSYEQGAAETYIAGMLCAWAFFFHLCCKCIWMPVPVPNICSIVELDQFYNLAIKMLSSLFANVPIGCVELFHISLVSFEL